MKKLSLQTWINKFLLVLARFPLTLLFIIGFSVLCFLSIQREPVHINENLWAFFGLGVLMNISVTLLLEETKKLKFRILFNILSIVLLAVYCFTLPVKLLEYQYYQVAAFGTVFVLAAFVVSFLRKNNEILFWNFSKQSIVQLIISSVFSSVLFGGLSIAILSLDKLFSIHIERQIYGDLSILSFVIFAPIYFLSNIPDEIEKRKSEVTFDKVIKIFGLYILLPILAIYTLILYVYLLQIVFKWQLPNGWVSTLVSVLGLGGFVCMMILYPLYLSKENKAVNLFSKLFPAFLFPLLILMSIGIARRISDYDLTINRLYILILNGWFYGICIYLYVKQSKQVKWILISFAIVAFLSSVGPWSVFSVTKKSLSTRLEKQLTQLHLLKDRKIILEHNKLVKNDSLYEMKTAETVRYLVRVFGNQSVQKYFTEPLKEKSESEILSMFKLENAPVRIQYFSGHLKNQTFSSDLLSFHSFVQIDFAENETLAYKNEKVNIELNDNNLIVTPINAFPFTIRMTDKLKSIIKENSGMSFKAFENDKLTFDGSNYKLIIISFGGKFDQNLDSINLHTFKAYLFY